AAALQLADLGRLPELPGEARDAALHLGAVETGRLLMPIDVDDGAVLVVQHRRGRVGAAAPLALPARLLAPGEAAELLARAALVAARPAVGGEPRSERVPIDRIAGLLIRSGGDRTHFGTHLGTHLGVRRCRTQHAGEHRDACDRRDWDRRDRLA